MHQVTTDEPTLIACHVGYNTGQPIRLVVRGTLPTDARVTARRQDGGEPLTSRLGPELTVDGWHLGPWHVVEVDIADLPADGGVVEVSVDGGTGALCTVACSIAPHRVASQTMSDVLYYFKAVRSSGEIDRKDTHARFYGQDAADLRDIDAHGGWLDASGDQSKFLSHLTYTRMMSPQQIPLCAWAMMEADSQLADLHPQLAAALHPRLRDEALFGADFLVRFQDPSGYFYTAIFDALTKQLDQRVITAPLQDSVRTTRYQAAYRHGGGMAIAALARAARLDDHGEHSPGRYFSAAVAGLEHLEEHNTQYSFDATESVIDDYCALLAATELEATFRTGLVDTWAPAASRRIWQRAALHRAASLGARYRTTSGTKGATPAGYLVGDMAGRPYFHAAESGLPILALVRFGQVFCDIEPDAAAAAHALAIQLCRDWVARTDAVPNPFGYPRALVQPQGGPPREAFFFPHDNETGYWWQGENANICSLSAAASLVAQLTGCPADLAARLQDFATAQLAWVLGRNPYDACMLQGRGHGNVEYSSVFQNVPGGILNGITSGFCDEDDIDFMPPGPARAGHTWRWAEQWIPHAGWFLLAAAAAG